MLYEFLFYLSHAALAALVIHQLADIKKRHDLRAALSASAQAKADAAHAALWGYTRPTRTSMFVERGAE